MTDERIKVKISMVGDAQVGKTSLMVRYTKDVWDSSYIETLGVNFLHKSINVSGNEVLVEIWDLGGQAEFRSMMSLACEGAHVVLYVFDLTRKATLNSMKTWFKQVRALNRAALPVLIGNKYDLFVALPPEEQEKMIKKAREFAAAMRAQALVFTSASHKINVKKLFTGIIAKLFDLPSGISNITEPGAPLLEFK